MYVYGLDLTLECVVVSFIQKRDKVPHCNCHLFPRINVESCKLHKVLIKVQFLDDVKLGHVLITNTNTNLILLLFSALSIASLSLSLSCCLKTLFNIVEDRLKKLLNFDVCVV